MDRTEISINMRTIPEQRMRNGCLFLCPTSKLPRGDRPMQFRQLCNIESVAGWASQTWTIDTWNMVHGAERPFPCDSPDVWIPTCGSELRSARHNSSHNYQE